MGPCFLCALGVVVMKTRSLMNLTLWSQMTVAMNVGVIMSIVVNYKLTYL